MSHRPVPFLAAAALAIAASVPATLAAQGFTMPRAGEPPPAVWPVPDPPSAAGPEEPADLIERGAAALLDNLLNRAAPHLEGLAQEMQGAMNDLAPVMDGLGTLVDDIAHYQAPERLPNGDILIRRKPGAPPPPPLDPLRGLIPDGDGAPPAPAIDPDAPQVDL